MYFLNICNIWHWRQLTTCVNFLLPSIPPATQKHMNTAPHIVRPPPFVPLEYLRQFCLTHTRCTSIGIENIYQMFGLIPSSVSHNSAWITLIFYRCTLSIDSYIFLFFSHRKQCRERVERLNNVNNVMLANASLRRAKHSYVFVSSVWSVTKRTVGQTEHGVYDTNGVTRRKVAGRCVGRC